MQYSMINYSHHDVHYTPVTYLFYNWNFVTFTFYLFFSFKGNWSSKSLFTVSNSSCLTKEALNWVLTNFLIYHLTAVMVGRTQDPKDVNSGGAFVYKEVKELALWVASQGTWIHGLSHTLFLLQRVCFVDMSRVTYFGL